MSHFRSHFEKVQLQLRSDDALATLDRFYFDRSKSSRLIAGVAISSRSPNVNGDAFAAQGAQFSLPTPLLWEHDWSRPLGRVFSIKTWGDQVHFEAEIGNNMPWVDQIWQAIIDKNADMASVEGVSLYAPPGGQAFAYWQLTEISVAQLGADPGAIITRCSERLPVVSLTQLTETVHWGAVPAWR